MHLFLNNDPYEKYNSPSYLRKSNAVWWGLWETDSEKNCMQEVYLGIDTCGERKARSGQREKKAANAVTAQASGWPCTEVWKEAKGLNFLPRHQPAVGLWLLLAKGVILNRWLPFTRLWGAGGHRCELSANHTCQLQFWSGGSGQHTPVSTM